MCTLGTIDDCYLFKNRDMEPGAGLEENIVHGCGRFRYVGVAGHASPLERGLNSGINEAGVAAAMTFVDRIPLTRALRTKIPRGVLIEEILRSADSLAAALRIAANFLCTTPLVGGNIVILASGGGAVIEELYPKFAIEMFSRTATVRTNHFLNLAVEGPLAVDKKNTLARYKRFRSLLEPAVAGNGKNVQPFGFAEIKQALSDHEGPHPICRHGSDAVTVSTAIYDIKKRLLHYVYGNPCSGVFAEYTV